LKNKLLCHSMSFHVEREVIASRELPTANVTLERFGSSVFPIVPSQLVGPGKPPAASFPRTLVRFFTGVGPLVSLQVGALGVDLFASGQIAFVNLSSLDQCSGIASGTGDGARRSDLTVELSGRRRGHGAGEVERTFRV